MVLCPARAGKVTLISQITQIFNVFFDNYCQYMMLALN